MKQENQLLYSPVHHAPLHPQKKEGGTEAGTVIVVEVEMGMSTLHISYVSMFMYTSFFTYYFVSYYHECVNFRGLRNTGVTRLNIRTGVLSIQECDYMRTFLSGSVTI